MGRIVRLSFTKRRIFWKVAKSRRLDNDTQGFWKVTKGRKVERLVTVNCFWKVAEGWKPGKVDNDIKGFWKVAKGRKVERLGKKRLWLCDSDDGFWKVAKSCVWLTDVMKVSGEDNGMLKMFVKWFVWWCTGCWMLRRWRII